MEKAFCGQRAIIITVTGILIQSLAILYIIDKLHSQLHCARPQFLAQLWLKKAPDAHDRTKFTQQEAKIHDIFQISHAKKTKTKSKFRNRYGNQ